MQFVLALHSLVRWIIVLVALVAVVKFAMGWLQKANAQKIDRTLMSAFSGLIDLQWLLGFVLLLMTGDFSMPRIEHTFTMIVAAVVAHLPMRWRNRADTNVLRNNLIIVVVVILLVVAGIASLPGNRWFLRSF
jgi:uncharacterized membrane protein YphA (DoxX/SURF4 family)